MEVETLYGVKMLVSDDPSLLQITTWLRWPFRSIIPVDDEFRAFAFALWLFNLPVTSVQADVEATFEQVDTGVWWITDAVLLNNRADADVNGVERLNE